MDITRKLASIQRIAEVKPIEGADRIVAYRVNGWWVVDQKDRYSVGDLVVYCEIDSWIPTELAPFLSKGRESKEFNGVKGERLRTVKLKGQLSQGLLLPGTPCPQGLMVKQFGQVAQHIFQEGDDVTEWLGIQKWEAPIPAQLSGQVKGNFPSAFVKSCQERVQNLNVANFVGMKFQVTEKLDGSSMSVYSRDLQTGVCSRNLDLQESDTNSFWIAAKNQQLLSIVDQLAKEFGKGVLLQGELCGPGIQGNPYKLTAQQFFLYNIQLEGHEFLSPELVQSIAERHGISHVPVLDTVLVMEGDTVEDILGMAEGTTRVNSSSAEREGLVFKSLDSKVQFKAISNRWLYNGGV